MKESSEPHLLPAAQALDHVLSLAKQAREGDVDAVVMRSRSLTVRVREGGIEKVDQSAGVCIGIRVLQKGRTGLASSERLSPQDLKRAFEQARSNAQWQDATEVSMLPAPGSVPQAAQLQKYNPELEKLTIQTLAQFGFETEEAIHRLDKRVSAIPHLAIQRSWQESIVASSHGFCYRSAANQVEAGCAVLVQENSQRKSGSYGWSARHWKPEQAKVIAEQAVKRATDLLPAKAIANTKIPVVLDEHTAPDLFNLYLGAFHAEAVQKGLSRLKGQLDQCIGASNLHLHDDPHLKGAPGSRYVDTEGVLTKPQPLIADGRLATFLHHVETANKDGVPPTGHAGRGAQSGISARAHNLVMPKGDKSVVELCAQAPRCLLVTELEGASGCSPLSGDISIGVQGMLYEQGQPVQAVEAVTIAGNFFDLLKNIQAYGNCYQQNLSSLFIPPMMIEGFSISG